MTAVAFSGLYDTYHGEPHALLTTKKGNRQTAMQRVYGKRYSAVAIRELLDTLIGAAAGSTAAATRKQVQAVADPTSNMQGGLRTIETKEIINRATTAADVTALKAIGTMSQQPSSYPADLAGNGGGGKLGF